MGCGTRPARWNGSTWGYAVLTITPEQLRCDVRVASTIKVPGGTLQQLATFTVRRARSS